MTDSTLQRVWDLREAISRRCDYDSRKLIHFYQSRRKTEDQTKESKRQKTDSRANLVTDAHLAPWQSSMAVS